MFLLNQNCVCELCGTHIANRTQFLQFDENLYNNEKLYMKFYIILLVIKVAAGQLSNKGGSGQLKTIGNFCMLCNLYSF